MKTKELPVCVEKAITERWNTPPGFPDYMTAMTESAKLALAAIGREPVELTEEQMRELRRVTGMLNTVPTAMIHDVIAKADRIRFGVDDPVPEEIELFMWAEVDDKNAIHNRQIKAAFDAGIELGRKSKEA